MSKAVTNEEVEDVLSSIRRLVSEDKRPLAGLSSTPREVVAPPAEVVARIEATSTVEPTAQPLSDRLVLTPALRVADAPDVPDAEEAPLDLGSVARKTWAPSDEAAEAQDEDAPMILFPVDGEDEIDALVHDTVETQADGSDLSDGDYGDEGYWDEEDDMDGNTMATAMHDVEDVQEFRDTEADFGDDGDWDDEISAHDDQWDVEVATDGLTLDTTERNVEADAVNQLDASVAPEPAEVAAKPAQDANLLKANVPLTAKIAALGAAIGKSPQDWEPDGDEANDLAATSAPAMAWEDDVELDARGAPLEEQMIDEIASAAEAEMAEEAGKAGLAAAFGGDDQLMDEEALRDLVSEIVRSELQGALGERITRNVRKLVRREIHRALTAQEIE